MNWQNGAKADLYTRIREVFRRSFVTLKELSEAQRRGRGVYGRGDATYRKLLSDFQRQVAAFEEVTRVAVSRESEYVEKVRRESATQDMFHDAMGTSVPAHSGNPFASHQGGPNQRSLGSGGARPETTRQREEHERLLQEQLVADELGG